MRSSRHGGAGSSQEAWKATGRQSKEVECVLSCMPDDKITILMFVCLMCKKKNRSNEAIRRRIKEPIVSSFFWTTGFWVLENVSCISRMTVCSSLQTFCIAGFFMMCIYTAMLSVYASCAPPNKFNNKSNESHVDFQDKCTTIRKNR